MIPLAAAFLLVATPTARLPQSGPVRVGEPAPAFGGWDLTGHRVLTLEGLRRTPFLQPLLLAFAASWCKACEEPFARLRAFATKHPEVRLVLVDVESDASRAQAFAARMAFDGPALLDKLEQIATAWGVGGAAKADLPRTFLIDAGGKVHAIYAVPGDDFERTLEADLAVARAAGAKGR